MSALAIFAFTACEEEQPMYEVVETVSVTSADLVFTPEGGTGTISFEAEGSVAASSSASWCSVAVSGSSATVTVSPYDGNSSRYSDIVLTCGEGSQKLCVHQYGRILAIEGLADIEEMSSDGGTVSFTVSSRNYTPDYGSDQDWIHLSFAEESLQVTIDPNQTPYTRYGEFYVGSDTLSVSQLFKFDFDAQMAGTWLWSGTTTRTGSTPLSTEVEFANYDPETSTFEILFSDMITGEQVAYPLYLDREDMTFTMWGGQVLDQETYYQGNRVYITTLVYAANYGYVTWGSDYGIKFSLVYDEATGKYNTTTREDVGNWTTTIDDVSTPLTYSTIYFELMSSDTPSSDARLRVRIGTRAFNLELSRKAE